MPRVPKVPTYRRHKGRDLAFVLIGKRPKYLGRWNSPESKVEYARVIREWAACPVATSAPARSPGAGRPAPSDLTVSEMLVAFLRHAEGHYRDRDGAPIGEAANYKDAAKPLRTLYGATLAAEFGPLALQAVRGDLVASGLARSTVNARVDRIRRVFRWAASMQMIPGSVPADLATVAGLQAGRTEAPEPEDVSPVPLADVAATLPHLSAVVAAMVRVQLHSGCRAGEVMRMTTGEVARGQGTWTYRPGRHKGTWRGKGRVIPLGPRAVEALAPFLKPDSPDAYVFAPEEAARMAWASRSAARMTKPSAAELARRSTGPGRVVAAKYDPRTYRQAIARACDRAGVPRWSPLNLRHAAATAIRAAHGLEAAANVLGHARPDTTLIYAERDTAKAREIMEKMG